MWVLIGGWVLAATAGWVNAVGFLGMQHQALSHMSGPLTILSNEVTRGDGPLAIKALTVIAAFFAGCAVSAAFIGKEALKLGRRYGVVLVIESVALLLAWRFLSQGSHAGEFLAAFACGLQNAMASSYSGTVIRTTHMTGIVTDLGIALGHVLRREWVDQRRCGLLALLLMGFVTGGIGGSYGFITTGFGALLIPAGITGIAGLGYTLWDWVSHRRS